MNENLRILVSKLEHLARMKRDLEYSISKMATPIQIIQSGKVESLTDDQRETISAFNSRFSSYQEQIGKTMKGVAIEEELTSERFGATLALMEKLGVIDDVQKWVDVRELRNSVNHVYEDDPEELSQILTSLVENAPYLFSVHQQMAAFVQDAYIEPSLKAAAKKPRGSTLGMG